MSWEPIISKQQEEQENEKWQQDVRQFFTAVACVAIPVILLVICAIAVLIRDCY